MGILLSCAVLLEQEVEWRKLLDWTSVHIITKARISSDWILSANIVRIFRGHGSPSIERPLQNKCILNCKKREFYNTNYIFWNYISDYYIQIFLWDKKRCGTALVTMISEFDIEKTDIINKKKLINEFWPLNYKNCEKLGKFKHAKKIVMSKKYL